MKSDEAEGRLKALIAAAGVDPENLTTADVGRTWDAVREALAAPGFRIVEERGLVPLRLEIGYEEV